MKKLFYFFTAIKNRLKDDLGLLGRLALDSSLGLIIGFFTCLLLGTATDITYSLFSGLWAYMLTGLACGLLVRRISGRWDAGLGKKSTDLWYEDGLIPEMLMVGAVLAISHALGYGLAYAIILSFSSTSFSTGGTGTGSLVLGMLFRCLKGGVGMPTILIFSYLLSSHLVDIKKKFLATSWQEIVIEIIREEDKNTKRTNI